MFLQYTFKMYKLFFIFSILFVSCVDSAVQNPDSIVFPDSNVSFQNHVLPVLRSNCGLSYCHGEVSPQGNIAIYDYFSLTTSASGALVIPYNPDGSLLIQIIEYKIPHTPNYQWKFTSNQRNGIRTWILEGAKNN